METVIIVVMIVGAVFIGIFSLPNLINVLKTKNTAGINLWMYLIFTFACIMFMIYGIGTVLDTTVDAHLAFGLPVLISNAFCVAIAVITLVIKFKNMSLARKEHMTELKYWETHYKKSEETK